MSATSLRSSALMQQMQSYTADETFKFTPGHADRQSEHARHVHSDRPADASARCAPIKAGHRDGTLLVAAFDGIPEFVELLKKGEIVASGHAAALSHGRESPGEALAAALKGETPEKQILVPIVVATSKNIDRDPADHQSRPCSPTNCQ